MTTITIERHDAGDRIVHWLHVPLMAIAMLTGWTIYTGQFAVMEMAQTNNVHILTGLLIVALNIIIFLYLEVATKELGAHIVGPKDIKNVITIGLNFVGLTKDYPTYNVVDPETKEYVKAKKYHPMVKMLLGSYQVGFLFLLVTGLSLDAPGSSLDLLTGFMSLVTVRVLHLLGFYFFVMSLMLHIYLSLIPVNRQQLKAMISGMEEVEVKD